MADAASFIGAGMAAKVSLFRPPRETATAGCRHSEGIRSGMPEESRRDAPAWRRDRYQRPGEIPRPPRRTRNDSAEAAGQPDQHDDSSPVSQRRAYNREYMRQWRRRNRERSRVYNREYQRKTADRRKLRQIARDAESNAERDPKCAYGCGRRATQTIERIDPRIWQPVAVPYCGSC